MNETEGLVDEKLLGLNLKDSRIEEAPWLCTHRGAHSFAVSSP